jgi:hypothetical protein
MTEDEQVQVVLNEWIDLGGIEPRLKEILALRAVRAMDPDPVECMASHPHRPSITCTNYAGHAVPKVHRNEQLSLAWHEDGFTNHDELGELTLVPETPDAAVTPDSARAMLMALMGARLALTAVDEAYPGRINAVLVRQVRTAAAGCAEAFAVLRDAVGEMKST